MKMMRGLGLDPMMRASPFYPRAWNNREYDTGEVRFDMIFGKSAERRYGASYCSATTSQLAFNMVDLQNQSYSHGGGTIAHQGSKVPAGSFSYTGPCPPEGVHHEYQWTVQALDANGKITASASASRPFPPR